MELGIYGSGDGYGHGSRSGDGYGSGYGSGSGYGDGHLSYHASLLRNYAGKHGAAAESQGALLAFWKSKNDGTPSNGGRGDKRKAGTTEEELGELSPYCGDGQMHATLTPLKWKGSKLWVVALYPPFKIQEDKAWSKKREIICEIPNFFETGIS